MEIDHHNPEASLSLEGGKVLNVFSGEILDANVLVKGDKIGYVGPRRDPGTDAALRLDVSGKVLVPGYVEPHCHPWNLYNPVSLGEEVCRLGTTTLVCDNLFFFLFMGVEGFEAFMTALAEMPAKFFWSIRAVPQTPMEGEAELFSRPNIERLLENPLALSVAEITRWHDLVRGSPAILEIIRFARKLGKRVDGHTAGAKQENLCILSERGVESCHESISAEEAIERLRLGFHVLLRQSSLRQDLRGLLKAVRANPPSARRVMMTTDCSSPAFQLRSGMMDRLIGIALEEGVDPVEAYRMATLNPACYFGIEDRVGGIAPGRDADILVLKDLRLPTPELVISRGQVVAKNGALLRPFPEIDWGRFFTKSSQIGNRWRAEADYFEIPCADPGHRQTVRLPVIKLVNAVITRIEDVEFPLTGGCADISARDGFCWIATLSRHGRWVANGAILGFSDRVEGIASTFNTAAEILAIGRSPAAMAWAVNRVIEMGGGIAAVEEGKAAFEVPLRLGGIMSDRPMKELAQAESRLQEFLSARGYPYHDPLYTFLFLPNDFLPEVRIHRKGVFDIKRDVVLWPARELSASPRAL
jgi:adenine deaminase